ncbi:uncharacterized protein [Diadema antillarum]|uniref:uncharacterized protein n=1 Tax=Diadema antillarum TaxID=105358 RepID=UPI003A8A608F
MFTSWQGIVYFAVYLFLSVVGTFGNVCSLIAVIKTPILRRRDNFFLVNLSFVDLMVTSVLLPWILVQTYYEAWPYICITHILEIVCPWAVYGYRPLQVLLLGNSAVNPYLYVWMNKHYRNAYQQIFSPLKEKA